MDTNLYSNKDCPICKGTGLVKTGEHLANRSICICVIANKRKEDAQRIIALRFPAKFAKMKLENYKTGDDPYNEHALLAAENFVNEFETACEEGWILGFWGETAAGKTHLSAGIARGCVERYLAKPYFFNVPLALREERQSFNIKPNKDEDAPRRISGITRAMEAEILILDDFGAEYHKDGAAGGGEVSWVYEQLYNILEQRNVECKPTIITSNWSPGALKARLASESAKRVLSRIERSEIVPALQVNIVPGANRQAEENAKKLFAPRVIADYELSNSTSGYRKRYDRATMLSVIAKFANKHGQETAKRTLIAKRVERDGLAVREHIDMTKIMEHLHTTGALESEPVVEVA